MLGRRGSSQPRCAMRAPRDGDGRRRERRAGEGPVSTMVLSPSLCVAICFSPIRAALSHGVGPALLPFAYLFYLRASVRRISQRGPIENLKAPPPFLPSSEDFTVEEREGEDPGVRGGGCCCRECNLESVLLYFADTHTHTRQTIDVDTQTDTHTQHTLTAPDVHL